MPRENDARFLHQNEVNLHNRETKWLPTSICSACIHLHRQPNANTKLDLRSPIVECGGYVQYCNYPLSILMHELPTGKRAKVMTLPLESRVF